jgi:hypothetical protein
VQKGLEVQQHPSQSLCEVKALTPSKIAGMGEFRNNNDFTATSGDAMGSLAHVCLFLQPS